MSYDLIIRGGRVVDGSGAAPRTADIAVQDGLIAEVGRIGGAARRTIEADGLTVTGMASPPRSWAIAASVSLPCAPTGTTG